MAGIDAYTKLMLHCDGTPPSTSFPDDSASAHTVTPFGTAQVDDTKFKFGQSLLLDGNSDYLTCGNDSDWDFGTGDFTIDWWEYRQAANGCSIARAVNQSHCGFMFGYFSSNWVFMSSNNSTWDIASSRTLGTQTLNQWVHYAVVRSGTTFKTYKNGVQSDTWESALALATSVNPLAIGAFNIDDVPGARWFNGYIDEVRVSKGIARWTAPFTPPTEPYSGPESASIDETANISDEWLIQSNPEQASIDETVELDDSWLIQSNPEQASIDETVTLSDSWSAVLSQNADYISEIISTSSLIFVTDTSPAKILHVDITDPENPVITGADLLSVTNAKSVTYDSNTELLYVACADGKVVKVDINDLETQTIINLSDTDDLLTIRDINNFSLIYTSTENAVGELYQIDERLVESLNTNFQYLTKIYAQLATNFNFIEAETLNTNFQYLAESTTSLRTDFKWLPASIVVGVPNPPVDRDDIIVTVNGVDLTAKDVKLDDIIIIHQTDEESQAVFTVARNHDNINETIAGFASELTNNNPVVITIAGDEEFTGKVSSLNCQYTKESEQIIVTALGEQPDANKKKVSLSLPTLDEDISLYSVLINNPNIYNPYIDPTDEEPKIYKGITVDLGEKKEQELFRGRYIESIPSNEDGYYASQINDGTFDFDNDGTYFWQVKAINYVTAITWGYSGFKYIGTSLGSVSSDTWHLNGASFWKQKEFDDTVTELGEYTVGSAPYKEINTKNGILITKNKYEDRPDGFYSVRDEAYDYEEYAKAVADLELEKLENINGNILPLTSCSMQLTLDAYYYYSLKLLTRINIDNTTKAGIYTNDNGFPLSIKTITINTASMSVQLSTSNAKSQTELEEIDDRYPDEEDYITAAYEARITEKTIMPTSQSSSNGINYNFL